MELQRIYFKAKGVIASNMSWEAKYDLIFSPEISQEVFKLSRDFDYCDPDTTYEEDVMAFFNSFEEYLWG